MKHHYVRKGGQPRVLIMEKNINTIRVVIDDDRHLSTGALEALLYIPRMIIHHILTKKLEMMYVASTWVWHMLTRDQMSICIERTSKFLGFIVEDSTYLNNVVMCDETWVHHYDPLTKRESEH